jgi:hypothetical protein
MLANGFLTKCDDFLQHIIRHGFVENLRLTALGPVKHSTRVFASGITTQLLGNTAVCVLHFNCTANVALESEDQSESMVFVCVTWCRIKDRGIRLHKRIVQRPFNRQPVVNVDGKKIAHEKIGG